MNRNDRKIAVAALVVLILALVGFYVGGGEEWQTPTKDAEGAGATGTYGTSGTSGNYGGPGANHKSQISNLKSQTPERFPFDPNSADSAQLLRLGLQPWQVRNIYRYRAKGGVYRRKEDFARLYGLTVKQYRELEPYIRISDDYRPAASLFAGAGSQSLKSQASNLQSQTSNLQSQTSNLIYPVKIKDGEHVVLNTADTAALRRVPGIGSYYAKEIISHGRWLGGYVSVDQLDEIDGFPQEAKKYFVIEHAQPRKLNVNKLSLNELRRHPYVNFYQAKAIVDYRRLHGDIKSLDDLSLSKDFPPEAIRRLEPYVEY